MKEFFGGFDHFWLLFESASHATLTTDSCQQTGSVHQNMSEEGNTHSSSVMVICSLTRLYHL
jgi:hypothetical protein